VWRIRVVHLLVFVPLMLLSALATHGCSGSPEAPPPDETFIEIPDAQAERFQAMFEVVERLLADAKAGRPAPAAADAQFSAALTDDDASILIDALVGFARVGDGAPLTSWEAPPGFRDWIQRYADVPYFDELAALAEGSAPRSETQAAGERVGEAKAALKFLFNPKCSPPAPPCGEQVVFALARGFAVDALIKELLKHLFGDVAGFIKACIIDRTPAECTPEKLAEVALSVALSTGGGGAVAVASIIWIVGNMIIDGYDFYVPAQAACDELQASETCTGATSTSGGGGAAASSGGFQSSHSASSGAGSGGGGGGSGAGCFSRRGACDVALDTQGGVCVSDLCADGLCCISFAVPCNDAAAPSQCCPTHLLDPDDPVGGSVELGCADSDGGYCPYGFDCVHNGEEPACCEVGKACRSGC
jgi:hypothetical protein